MFTKIFSLIFLFLNIFALGEDSPFCHYLLEFKVDKVYCKVLEPDELGNKIQFSYKVTITQRILDYRLVQIDSQIYKIIQNEVELYDTNTKKLPMIDCFSKLSFKINSFTQLNDIEKEEHTQEVVSLNVNEIYDKYFYDIEKSNKILIKGLQCKNLTNLVQKNLSFDAARMGIVTIQLEVPAEQNEDFITHQLDAQNYVSVFAFDEDIYSIDRNTEDYQPLGKPSILKKSYKPKNNKRNIQFNDQVLVRTMPTNSKLLDQKIINTEDKNLLRKFIIEDDFTESSEEQSYEFYEPLQTKKKPSMKQQLEQQKKYREILQKLKDFEGTTDEQIADRYII